MTLRRKDILMNIIAIKELSEENALWTRQIKPFSLLGLLICWKSRQKLRKKTGLLKVLLFSRRFSVRTISKRCAVLHRRVKEYSGLSVCLLLWRFLYKRNFGFENAGTGYILCDLLSRRL